MAKINTAIENTRWIYDTNIIGASNPTSRVSVMVFTCLITTTAKIIYSVKKINTTAFKINRTAGVRLVRDSIVILPFLQFFLSLLQFLILLKLVQLYQVVVLIQT